MRFLKTLDSTLYKVELSVAGIALFVMLVSVFINVCVRYFNWPLPNVGELGLAAMAPVTFVGASACTHGGHHITIDILEHVGNDRLRYIASWFVNVLVVVFAVMYIQYSYMFLDNAIITHQRWLDMGTPVYLPGAFYFLGMCGVLFHSLCNTLYNLRPCRS